MIEDMKKWADDLARIQREHGLQATRILELEAERDRAIREKATALELLDAGRRAAGSLNGVDERALMDTAAVVEFKRGLTTPDQVVIKGRTKRAAGANLPLALKDYFRAIGHEVYALPPPPPAPKPKGK